MKRDPRKVLQLDESLSQALRALPRRVPPAALTSSLRVLASREQRRRVYGSGNAYLDRLRLFSHNLMRPLALPFAGGVFSTIVLFSMWLVPMYPVRGSNTTDVPTVLNTAAAVKLTLPIAASAGDVVVDVTVDGDGRMIDYQIVSGDPSLRRGIESVLLATVFTPATSFGQPVEGRIRLLLHSSHIDVKG